MEYIVQFWVSTNARAENKQNESKDSNERLYDGESK